MFEFFEIFNELISQSVKIIQEDIRKNESVNLDKIIIFHHDSKSYRKIGKTKRQFLILVATSYTQLTSIA